MSVVDGEGAALVVDLGGDEVVVLLCGRPGFNPWVGKIPWRRKWHPTPVFLPGESLRTLCSYCLQKRLHGVIGKDIAGGDLHFFDAAIINDPGIESLSAADPLIQSIFCFGFLRYEKRERIIAEFTERC